MRRFARAAQLSNQGNPMKKHPVPTLCALAIAAVLAQAAPVAEAADFKISNKPIKSQYIVVFKEEVAALGHEKSSRPKAREMAANVGRAHGATVLRTYDNALRGFVAHADDRALARLLADPRVEYVEEDGIAHASAVQNGATWGLDRVDQRTLPLNGAYSYSSGASNVHAYIVDTGIRASHSDFGGRVSGGANFINDNWGTGDCAGHGTHVAGTVGGATWGVAKSVRLHPIRVLGCDGSGSWSGIIAGLDWVARYHVKPAVANLSLGGGVSQSVDDAVNRLNASGVTVLVAAGNDNSNACNFSPARAAGAITVGSTTSTDARSSFSNYGSCVNLFGPGSNIRSAWSTGNTVTNVISGTSMATPHVAGAAALYLSSNPSATPGQVRNWLLSNATQGRISGTMGSPNLMLYAGASTGGDGGNGGDGGGAPCTGCAQFSGSLSGTGDADVLPNGNYYQSMVSGTHRGWLRGASGTDFDLFLYRWNGSSWVQVAQSDGPSSEEAVVYAGSPGYYYWRAYSHAGSGSYSFWLQRP